MNRCRRLAFWGAPLIALATTVSCTTVTEYAVGEAVHAATGAEADLAGRRVQGPHPRQPLHGAQVTGGGVAVAVHELGPTFGWERGFRLDAWMDSGHYRNRICVNLPLRLDLRRLGSRSVPTPFASPDRLDSSLFVQENNQGIDPEYVGFGEVRVGGPSPATPIWRSGSLLGRPRAGCPALGVFSFGQVSALALILR